MIEQNNYIQKYSKKKFFLRDINKAKTYYLLILPVVAFFIIFKYFPLCFLQIAFKDYSITRKLADCDWVGFKHFIDLFKSYRFITALVNTLKLGIVKIIFGFPAPIILAIMINEIKNVAFRRVSQTIMYLPHFISWIVIGGIFVNLLSPNNGVINNIIESFGGESIYFMGLDKYFVSIMVTSSIWKETGWGTILYLATMSRIPPSLYESAVVDGANKMQQIIHITLPALSNVIVVLLILRLGHILTIGFEQIMVLGSPITFPTRHVLDTYVYQVGLKDYKFDFATAAGVFKSLVAFIMIYGSNKLSKVLGQKGLY